MCKIQRAKIRYTFKYSFKLLHQDHKIKKNDMEINFDFEKKTMFQVTNVHRDRDP